MQIRTNFTIPHWILTNCECILCGRQIAAPTLEQLARPDSVFRFYQKLVHLRHTHPVIVYGDYRLLLPEDPQIFAYIRNLDGRQLLAVSNLSGAPASMEQPVEFRDGKILISNYEDTGLRPALTLRPWEAFAIEL